jgi:pyruvate dehydrogenase E1 component alpha subunit
MAAPKLLDGLPAAKWVELYTIMVRIRQFEERIMPLLKEGRIKGTAHPSVGQEAVAVGVCAPMRTDDILFGTYRSHATYIARDGDLKKMFAELYGKATGCAKGKGGSMHLVDLAAGFLGAVPIVGSTIPIAVGATWGSRLRGEQRVVVIFFGDAAVEEGSDSHLG